MFNDNYKDSIIGKISKTISRLPDLERLISRIHAGSCRVSDFVNVLTSFENTLVSRIIASSRSSLQNLFDALKSELETAKSSTLRQTCNFSSSKLVDKLEFFKQAFDFSVASKNESIHTFNGFDEEYDASVEALSIIERKLESYRRDLEKELGYVLSYCDNLTNI